MRKELEKYLTQSVEIHGKIQRFGNMKFDGDETIVFEDPETGLIRPMRYTDYDFTEPMFYKGKTSKITDATVNGEKIGDGHIWLPEDLSMKDFNEGDKVIILGNVEKYKKKNGQYDYCIKRVRVEKAKE